MATSISLDFGLSGAILWKFRAALSHFVIRPDGPIPASLEWLLQLREIQEILPRERCAGEPAFKTRAKGGRTGLT